jgi:hypothetical protein
VISVGEDLGALGALTTLSLGRNTHDNVLDARLDDKVPTGGSTYQ